MEELSNIRKGFLPMYKDLKADIAEIRKQVESDKTYLDAEFSKQVAALSEKIEGIDPVDYAAISADIERIKKSIPTPVVKTESVNVSGLVSKSDFLDGLDRLETRLGEMEKAGKQNPVMEVAITNLEQLKDALQSSNHPSGTQTVVNSQRYPFKAGGAQSPLDLVRTLSGSYAMPVANFDGTPIGSSTTAVPKTLIDKTTTTNVVYIGQAASGTAKSDALWTITKIDKTTSPVAITHTGATAVWDNRVSGSYS